MLRPLAGKYGITEQLLLLLLPGACLQFFLVTAEIVRISIGIKCRIPITPSLLLLLLLCTLSTFHRSSLTTAVAAAAAGAAAISCSGVVLGASSVGAAGDAWLVASHDILHRV